MNDKSDSPETAPEALRVLSCKHDPETGHVLLSLNGHAVNLVSVQQVESLLAILGKARSEMQPPLPDTLPPESLPPAPVLDRLALVTQDDVPPIKGGAILSVRSSYYGWQSMQLHPAFCQQLANDLLGFVPMSAEVPPGTTFN